MTKLSPRPVGARSAVTIPGEWRPPLEWTTTSEPDEPDHQQTRSPRGRSRLDSRGLTPPSVVHWIPLVATGYYLLVLLGNAGDLLRHEYWNSDIASAPLLADRLARSGPSGAVIQAQLGYLQLDLWTQWLPAHHFIWEWVFGIGFMCLAIGSAGWGVARLSTAWTGATAAAILAVASPVVLYGYLGQTIHTSTWMCQCLLFAFAAWAFTRSAGTKRTPLIWRGAAIAIFVGYWSASDQLLLLDGVLPFGIATLCVLFTRSGKTRPLPSLACLAVVAGSLISMWAVEQRFAAQHWSSPVPSGRYATPDEVATHLGYLLRGIPEVGNGDFFGAMMNTRGLLLAVCAALAFLGVASPPLLLRKQHPAVVAQHAGPAMLFGAAYWTVVALAVCAGFLFTDVVHDPTAARYLTALLCAAACTAPLLSREWRRGGLTLALATALIAMSATANLGDIGVAARSDPDDARLQQLTVALETHGVTRGYGSYWDAHAISWNRPGIAFLPVDAAAACLMPPGTLCPFAQGMAAGLYAPHRGQRSFFVSDPKHPLHPSVQLGGQPDPARYGLPTGTYSAAGVTVYEYPYDLAERFMVGPSAPPPSH